MNRNQAFHVSQSVLGEIGFNYNRANQEDILTDHLTELTDVGTLEVEEAAFVLDTWRDNHVTVARAVPRDRRGGWYE